MSHLPRAKRTGRQGSRPHKYGAKATTLDGIRFPSRKEAGRYAELKLLEQVGEIRNLSLQPWFVLMAPVMEGGLDNVNDGKITSIRPIGHYRGDFNYEERVGTKWQRVVEDTKGFRTTLYRWKKRHVEAQYGITLRET